MNPHAVALERTFAGPGTFRFLLAALVLLSHISLINLGLPAVYAFFILSGYWIARMWRRKYAALPHPYATFLMSRALRLLPVFLLGSLLSWVVAAYLQQIPAHMNLWHESLSSFLIIGYKSLAFRPNAPAWSLDVEAQFYLLAPLLAAIVGLSVSTLAAIAALSLAAWALGDRISAAPFLIFFAVGMSSALAGWRPGRKLAYCSLVATASVLVIIVLSPWRDLIVENSSTNSLYTFNPAISIAIGLFVAPWALYTTAQRGPRIDATLGDLSYILYVIHWPICQFLFSIVPGHGLILKLFQRFEILTLSILASLLILYLFDTPLQKLRERWLGAHAEDKSWTEAPVAIQTGAPY